MATSIISSCTWLMALLLSIDMDFHEYSLRQHEQEERAEELSLALEREGFSSLEDAKQEYLWTVAAAHYCATIKEELPFLLP